MDSEVIRAYTDSVRNQIFETFGVEFEAALDLEGFENFVYGVDNRVIRITHESHRTQHQILGELEFLRYLKASGAAVAGPIPFDSGDEIITMGDFHVCQFERATGVAASMELPFTHAVIKQWGRCIGVFHRLARDFKPIYQRQNWHQDENHQFDARIPIDQTVVLQRSKELMTRLSKLEESSSSYGLIHSDAHAGNYVFDNGSLTFFDFDDCLTTWYGYDVATILVGVALQPWVEGTQQAMTKAVDAFLPIFMEGYSEESESSCLLWDQMHDFLKLRELSLYGVIHAHMNPDDLGDLFPQKFMRERRARIENEQTYVELDFSVY